MSAQAATAGEVSTAPVRPVWKRWSAAAGAALIAASLLPPLEPLAQRYLLAETIQFATFAIIGPALIVLGAPWDLLRLSRPGGTGALDRLAAGRAGGASFLRAGIGLLAYMAVTLAWRLPPAMNELATQPALVLAELATLLPAGLWLWLELVSSPPVTPRLPRPQRAAIAALSMWSIWVVAYAIGMNSRTIFSAYGSLPGRAISLMADQQIASMIMWVVAGFAFIPVVLVTMLGWLNSSEASEEEEFQRRFARDENQRAVVRGWGRPTAGRRPS